MSRSAELNGRQTAKLVSLNTYFAYTENSGFTHRHLSL